MTNNINDSAHLVVVAAALAPDANAAWHVLNTLGPHSLVKLRVHTDIGGSHHLGGELADGANSTRSTLLESTAEREPRVTLILRPAIRVP